MHSECLGEFAPSSLWSLKCLYSEKWGPYANQGKSLHKKLTPLSELNPMNSETAGNAGESDDDEDDAFEFNFPRRKQKTIVVEFQEPDRNLDEQSQIAAEYCDDCDDMEVEMEVDCAESFAREDSVRSRVCEASGSGEGLEDDELETTGKIYSTPGVEGRDGDKAVLLSHNLLFEEPRVALANSENTVQSEAQPSRPWPDTPIPSSSLLFRRTKKSYPETCLRKPGIALPTVQEKDKYRVSGRKSPILGAGCSRGVSGYPDCGNEGNLQGGGIAWVPKKVKKRRHSTMEEEQTPKRSKGMFGRAKKGH